MSLHLPPMCDERNWTADFFPSLLNFQTIHGKKRLTFSFLLVSPWFFLLLPSVYSSSLWPCLSFSSVSVDYPLSCLPLQALLPFSPRPSCPTLPLYEVQGSPITQRGLRKLYGLCPQGCHIVLSSVRLQVRSSQWLPAQQPQLQRQHRGCIDSARFKYSSCLSGWLAPSHPPTPSTPPPLLPSRCPELICLSRHGPEELYLRDGAEQYSWRLLLLLCNYYF